MKLFYTDQFVLPLPADHRFPMSKYALLRQRVFDSGLFTADLEIPEPATDQQLTLAHRGDYVRAVSNGTLTPREQRKIGFPWSEGMVERSRRSVGATIAGARAALREGYGINLAGGTHHAHWGSGGGYCVFNDVVVAARVMQREGRLQRAVVLDCDVHHGDGTASLCVDDPSIFTFSIHSEHNYPFHKPPSDLDIGLEDGTQDDEYLTRLEGGLTYSLDHANADLAFYLAGADPFEGDRLGRLKVSKAGLLARDDLVLSRCREKGLPVVVVMAGGYAKNVTDIVDIHWQTIYRVYEMNGSRR